MSEIFRLLMMRPAQVADPVVVTPSTDYLTLIEEARHHDQGRQALRTASEAIIALLGVHSIDDLPMVRDLLALESALKSLAHSTPAGSFATDMAATIKDHLGATPQKVAADKQTTETSQTLQDLLIAAKMLSRDGAVEAVQLETALRMIDLVLGIAAGSASLDDPASLGRALARSTRVGQILPPRVAPDKHDEQQPDDRESKHLAQLRDRADRLGEVARALAHLDPVAFQRPESRDPEAPNPSEPPVRQYVAQRLAEAGRAGELQAFDLGAVAGFVADLDLVAVAGDIAADARAVGPQLVLTRSAADGLGDQALKVVNELGLDLTQHPTPTVVARLDDELTAVHLEIAALEYDETTLQLIGSAVVDTKGLSTHLSKDAGLTPTSHGSVQPVGVGDLLVVRQQIKRYEGGELAHIENVLDGEHHTRKVRRAQETETTITVEEETTKEEERDSQSTERFELQREASSVIKDDTAFKVGLSVSGSYGPTIEFKASADIAMNHSKEEATKTASKYSKEVTDRAASKVTERRRSQRILRTLEQFEDVTEHGMNNPAGNGHVIGAYQWVDKVYEAQVYNYGRRMMFDLMIPEPGAFWLHASTSRPLPGTTSVKPLEFTLPPAQVDQYNYKVYVHRYQVPGVKPPPTPYIAVAKTVEGAATDADDGVFTKVADILIPAGYQAVSAFVTGLMAMWHGDWSIDYAIGKTSWRQANGASWSHASTLSAEEGTVPFALKTFHAANVAVAVEITCQLSPQALDAWRLETHAAIVQAYLKMLRDHEDELAALQVQAVNAVQGRNPLENRQIERSELRKHAIATLTAQQFDLFGAVSTSLQGFPELNLLEAAAEGRYIRFFEQAFEWEQMMYVFYPYYWGRKYNWLARSQLQDTDTQFADFLKAGAARVVLPVRPGFETAVAHFLDTGEIWDGADPPLLSSPLYVSIIQEIKERDLATGAEVPQGDSWDVRLPTTLVRLRPDGSLPTWHKDANGDWVPV